MTFETRGIVQNYNFFLASKARILIGCNAYMIYFCCYESQPFDLSLWPRLQLYVDPPSVR